MNDEPWAGSDRRHTQNRRNNQDRRQPETSKSSFLRLEFSTIYALIIQSVVIIIFATNLAGDVKANKEANIEIRAAMYTKEDARRDREFTTQLFENLHQRDADAERRISLLEGSLAQILNEHRNRAMMSAR